MVRVSRNAAPLNPSAHANTRRCTAFSRPMLQEHRTHHTIRHGAQSHPVIEPSYIQTVRCGDHKREIEGLGGSIHTIDAQPSPVHTAYNLPAGIHTTGISGIYAPGSTLSHTGPAQKKKKLSPRHIPFTDQRISYGLVSIRRMALDSIFSHRKSSASCLSRRRWVLVFTCPAFLPLPSPGPRVYVRTYHNRELICTDACYHQSLHTPRPRSSPSLQAKRGSAVPCPLLTCLHRRPPEPSTVRVDAVIPPCLSSLAPVRKVLRSWPLTHTVSY